MDNRIRRVLVRNIQASPAQAEVWITVVPQKQAATAEVRGRLMGPRCPYANTVEVAYPLRPLSPSQQPTEAAGLTRRVIIPEASLWEPQCPFLYEGPIELWQDGQLRDRAVVRHGLCSVHLKDRSLFVNGRQLLLQGREVSDCSDDEALELRRAGCNLLIAPVGSNTLPLWDRADRLGFLMLGLVKDDSAETVRLLDLLSAHPSCLGWLIEAADSSSFRASSRHGLTGLSCTAPPNALALSGASFLFGPMALANLGKPLLVKGEGSLPFNDGCPILGNVR